MSILIGPQTSIPELPLFGGTDEDRYEIVDGVKVEMPPMSAESTGLAFDIAHAITTFGVAKDIGKCYPDMLFRLPLPVDRNRRPDFGFVPFSRGAKNRLRPSTNAWDVLPGLMGEIVSPTDLAEDLRAKVKEYFQAGVQEVWVVYPELQLVDVYKSLTDLKVLTRDDELDGGSVVPGFRLPLRELFLEKTE